MSSSKKSFRQIKELLPKVLQDITGRYQDRPDLVIAAWKEIVGSHASMTEALSFYNGILTVKVKSATLYSLLTQYERARLLKNLQDKFPQVAIKNIRFHLA